jgi:hypothetical protein
MPIGTLGVLADDEDRRRGDTLTLAGPDRRHEGWGWASVMVIHEHGYTDHAQWTKGWVAARRPTRCGPDKVRPPARTAGKKGLVAR